MLYCYAMTGVASGGDCCYGNGCDSTVVLMLGVISVNTAVELQGNTLTAQSTGAAYQWVDCTTNTPIAGATASSFTPSATGSYAVIITNMDGCTGTSVCTEVIVVSTKMPWEGTGWQLLPNPAHLTTTLRLELPASVDIFLEMYDLTGRLLKRHILAAGEQERAINLADLPEGLFLVRLTDGRHQSETKRLIKVAD